MIQTGPLGATLLFVGWATAYTVWQGVKWVLRH